MKSKEELIEKMDLTLYSVFLGYHGDDRDVDEELCRELAQATLEALCRALPEVTYSVMSAPHGYTSICSNYSMPVQSVDNGSELYNQLKQYGENK